MSDWPYFSEVDERMDGDFMDKLIALRQDLGFALPVNSSFRDPEHNKRVGGADDSPHLLGRAVDIAVSGERAFKVVQAAPRFGFVGIGVKQHGPHEKRFIHLDDCENVNGLPRPWVWTYA